jgi:hypothetical protein
MEAEIDTRPPDGIALTDRSPEELAEAAAEWFERHRKTWAGSERARRWARLP